MSTPNGGNSGWNQGSTEVENATSSLDNFFDEPEVSDKILDEIDNRTTANGGDTAQGAKDTNDRVQRETGSPIQYTKDQVFHKENGDRF